MNISIPSVLSVICTLVIWGSLEILLKSLLTVSVVVCELFDLQTTTNLVLRCIHYKPSPIRRGWK